ncbi:MAG: hypothetical protein KatS3mg131_3200 [Candidatus Tectimicrobiota bacterium]|nr:MAG: hypothetical protein KatS3mg131_3200 [Candidatus Tectomicrobia bacterium]
MPPAPNDAVRHLLGREFVRRQEEVTRDRLIAYATLVGATNPIYFDAEAARAQGYRDIIAVPTYVTHHGAEPIAPPELGFRGGGINAGYDCTFYNVVYPGDTLTYATRLVDLYDKTGRSGTLRFVVRETMVTKQDGETVAVIRNRFILDW